MIPIPDFMQSDIEYMLETFNAGDDDRIEEWLSTHILRIEITDNWTQVTAHNKKRGVIYGIRIKDNVGR